MQHHSVCVLATLLLVLNACSPRRAPVQESPEEAYVASPGAVCFDIEIFDRGNSSFALAGTYASQGRTAKFQVEFGPSKPMETGSKTFSMRKGEGRFVSEPGSDASVLLLDLKKALEAKKLPSKVQRLGSLPFTFM